MSLPKIPIYHTYDVDDPEPRLPQAGDKALCGHVKLPDDPSPSGLLWWWGQPCVVCADLDRYWHWVFDEADEECAW